MKHVFVALLVMALVCAPVAQPIISTEDNRTAPSGDELDPKILKRHIPQGGLQALQNQNPEPGSSGRQFI
uniref:Secreted protein n=1 Tax=Anopheles minimus TaxID=112268 RepID=A0A182VS79_9DIPT